jgi:hypothetical protein
MENEITKLKINYATMSEKIDNLSTTVNRVEGKLDSFIIEERESRTLFEKRFEKACDSFDQKYASKRIEKVVDAIGWVIITSVIVAILAIVIK